MQQEEYIDHYIGQLLLTRSSPGDAYRQCDSDCCSVSCTPKSNKLFKISSKYSISSTIYLIGTAVQMACHVKDFVRVFFIYYVTICDAKKE